MIFKSVHTGVRRFNVLKGKANFNKFGLIGHKNCGTVHFAKRTKSTRPPKNPKISALEKELRWKTNYLLLVCVVGIVCCTRNIKLEEENKKLKLEVKNLQASC